MKRILYNKAYLCILHFFCSQQGIVTSIVAILSSGKHACRILPIKDEQY